MCGDAAVREGRRKAQEEDQCRSSHITYTSQFSCGVVRLFALLSRTQPSPPLLPFMHPLFLHYLPNTSTHLTISFLLYASRFLHYDLTLQTHFTVPSSLPSIHSLFLHYLPPMQTHLTIFFLCMHTSFTVYANTFFLLPPI